MSTTRKLTPAQARKAALKSDYTPLYAVAGLTDALARSLQAAWAESSAKAEQRFAGWQGASEKQTKAVAGDVTSFVKTLPIQVKALPETTRTRLIEWQKSASEFAYDVVRDAGSAYGNLAGRGKRVVDETISSATEVAADLADAVDPAFEKVQETVTQARKTVTGRTATETLTPRSAQKAAETRAAARGAAEERAAARRAAAKRAAATRAARKAAAAQSE
jgi:hypothetical protein